MNGQGGASRNMLRLAVSPQSPSGLAPSSPRYSACTERENSSRNGTHRASLRSAGQQVRRVDSIPIREPCVNTEPGTRYTRDLASGAAR